MKNSLELLIELQEKTPDWKELLFQFMDNNLEDTDDSYNIVFSIFQKIRESYKITKEIPDDISKALDDSKLKEFINEYIENSLELYFDLSLLRNIQKEQVEITKKLVSIILKEYVFHNGIYGDKKIHELLESTSMYDEEKVQRTIRALDFLTKNSIITNMNRDCIKDNIQAECNISKEICEQIADMIWENRMELKLDYIISLNSNDVSQ